MKNKLLIVLAVSTIYFMINKDKKKMIRQFLLKKIHKNLRIYENLAANNS